jgi:hypothetical protein
MSDNLYDRSLLRAQHAAGKIWENFTVPARRC